MNHQSSSRQSRPWTYRVENCPKIRPDQLCEVFVPEDRPGIEVRSLCPAVDPQSDTLTGTIAFTVPQGENPRPPRLLDPEASEISVDDDFYGLTPLNTPEEPVVADIIAVTGLAGHAFGSWACSPRTMWLRDFLPHDIKNVRVLTYGYNSQLKNATSRGVIGDHVRRFKQRLLTLPQSSRVRHRPIIFIGHSLGCILIKKTLVEIYSTPTASYIADVPFIVFFGAPHRGLDSPSLRTVLGLEDLSKDIVDELGESSPTLTDLSESFSRIAHKLSICSCFEELPTKTLIKDKDGILKREGPPAMMVTQNSALLHAAREIRVPCKEDHSKIAKLKRSESSVYIVIKNHMRYALERHELGETSLLSDQRYPEQQFRFPGPQVGVQASPYLPPSSTESDGHETSRLSSPALTPKTEANGSNSSDTPDAREQLPHFTQTDQSNYAGPPSSFSWQITRSMDADRPKQPEEKQAAEIRSEAANLGQTISPNKGILASIDMKEQQAERRKRNGEAEQKQAAETRSEAANFGQSVSSNECVKASVDTTEKEVDRRKQNRGSGSTTSPIVPSRSLDRSSPLRLSRESNELLPPRSEDHTPSVRSRHSLPHAGVVTPQPQTKRRSSGFFNFLKTSPKSGKPETHEFLKAAAENDVELLRDLHLRGAELGCKTSQAGNRTALHEAATHDSYEVADYLVKNGAKKDSRSKNETTPLHEACFSGSNEVAALLIRAGAQLEAENLGGETPLSIASRRGWVGIVKELLDNNANHKSVNGDGKNPLQIAEARGHREICQILRQKGARLPRRNTKDEEPPQWPGLF